MLNQMVGLLKILSMDGDYATSGREVGVFLACASN